MARYTRDVTLNKPEDFVQFIMNDFLQKNQFVMSDWKGEPAYRTGDALIEGFKYLKWSYINGVFHLEAWLKGTAGGEWDLEGFVGSLQKKPYKDNLEQLIMALQQEIPVPPVNQIPQPEAAQTDISQPEAAQTGAQQSAGQQSNPQQANPQPQVVPVRTVDNTGAATAALVFGIISIVGGILIPLAGLICGVLGISRARMGLGSSKAGQAKAGKICSIIGIVISVLLWAANILRLFV